MGLLSDLLEHLLASDPAGRRAGLVGLVGRAFGTEPVVVSHPEVQRPELTVVRLRKTATRPYAITVTIGLAPSVGREWLALTETDGRDPVDRDRFAWLVGAVAGGARGGAIPLPAGCLGRSSHTNAVVGDPWPMPPLDRPEYERIVGGRFELVVPITDREASYVADRGADALLDAMRAQGVAPFADRTPGGTVLS